MVEEKLLVHLLKHISVKVPSGSRDQQRTRKQHAGGLCLVTYHGPEAHTPGLKELSLLLCIMSTWNFRKQYTLISLSICQRKQ